MATGNDLASESPEHNPVPALESQITGAGSPGAPSYQRAVPDGAFLLALIGPPAVALLLLLVVLPIRDGTKARDSARETYGELHSMSYAAGWEARSEIGSVRSSLDSDLSSLDSGLWSVGSGLGPLAHDVGVDSRPRVRELEDAIDARRDELRQLRRSADAQFEQLQDSVEARFGELEGAADAALDGHWDESGRRFSRDTRIVLAALGATAAVLLAFWLAGLWISRLSRRDLAQPVAGP